MHWAVAQLGVGQTELEAVGLFEKLFSIGAARSCRGEEKVWQSERANRGRMLKLRARRVWGSN